MIADNIVNLCARKGISISRLEKSVGLGNATIKRWNTCSPSVENIKKVADFFNVKIDDLISNGFLEGTDKE